MAAKAKVTSKAKPKAAKKISAPKAAPKKTIASKAAAKNNPAVQPAEKKKTLEAKPVPAPVQKAEKNSAPPKPAPVVKRVINPALERRRLKKPVAPQRSASQFSFMKKPGAEYEFEVGDIVEVFCDHEKNRDRIRGWVKGIIVQVDHKLAAVQFRSNVYLTDGWMVPDRILWFPVNSEHIRPVAGKKPVEKKDVIPDY